MKIKFNWGTKLTIAIILFMSFIIYMVYRSISEEFYLVEKDYYPKGILYQDQINKIKNYQNLNDQISCTNQGSTIQLEFPEIFNDSNTKGNLHFYRPSGTLLDKHYRFQTDSSGKQFIDISIFKKGKYILKIDLEREGIAYYHELVIFI